MSKNLKLRRLYSSLLFMFVFAIVALPVTAYAQYTGEEDVIIDDQGEVSITTFDLEEPVVDPEVITDPVVDPNEEEPIGIPFVTSVKCENPYVDPGVVDESGSTEGSEGDGGSVEPFDPGLEPEVLPAVDETVIDEPVVDDGSNAGETGEVVNDDVVSEEIDPCAYAYSVGPVPADCEEGQEDCIMPYYRTLAGDVNNDSALMDKTLAMADGDTESSSTDSESTDIQPVAASLEDEAAGTDSAEGTDMEAASLMSVTAMPKTGAGSNTATLLLVSGLALTWLGFVIYRKRRHA